MQKNHLMDLASTVTLILTVFLFSLSLIENGFTEKLLLEAGVFLISAKLVIGNFQNKAALKSIESKLDELLGKQSS